MIRLGELVMILDSASARAVGVGDCPAAGTRSQDGAQRHRARPRAPGLWPAPAAIDCGGTLFAPYLRERIAAFPELTGSRLLREIKELGYTGGYTAVKDLLRTIRPKALQAFERRFETPPGKQAQVDFLYLRHRLHRRARRRADRLAVLIGARP